MAQNQITRKPSPDYLKRRVHIINSFSHIYPGTKQILIHIGYYAGVRIQSRISCKYPGKNGSCCGGCTYIYPGLDYSVAFHHSFQTRVNYRFIQWVGYCPYQFSGGVYRQLSVRIQRQYIFYLTEYFRIAPDSGKTCLKSAQYLIEFFQFSPFAFPPHPLFFPVVSESFTVQ